MERLVSLFLESSKDYVSEIREASQGGDWGRVEIAAHTLKSGAGSLGARAVFHLAEELEEAARGDEGERKRQLGNELCEVYEKTCIDLVRVIES